MSFVRAASHAAKQDQTRLWVHAGYSRELHAHADSIHRDFWEIEAGCSPSSWREGRSPKSQPTHFQLMGRESWILQLTSYWSLQIWNAQCLAKKGRKLKNIYKIIKSTICINGSGTCANEMEWMTNRTKEDLSRNNDGNVAATDVYKQQKPFYWRSKNNHNKSIFLFFN